MTTRFDDTRPARRRAVLPGALAVALALTAAGGSARAQDASATATREQARMHFERGIEFAASSRWFDAIRELEASRALRVTPSVLFNLGVAYQAVGRNRDAIAALEGFQQLAGAGTDPERVRDAATRITQMQGALGALLVRAEPAQATVSIDGAPVASPRAPSRLDPGRHVVLVEASGYRPISRAVTLAPGEQMDLEVQLVSTESAARLLVTAEPGDALIAIDGRPVSNGSADEYVGPGRHTIEVRRRDYSTFRRELDADRGTTTRIRAVLEDRRSVTVRPWFWGVVGGGAVVVAAAATVGGILLFSTTDPLAQGRLGSVQLMPTGH